MSLQTPYSNKSSDNLAGGNGDLVNNNNSNSNTLNGNNMNGMQMYNGNGGNNANMENQNLLYDTQQQTQQIQQPQQMLSDGTGSMGSITHIPITSYPASVSMGNSIPMTTLENQTTMSPQQIIAMGGGGTLLRQHYPSLTPSQHQVLLQQHLIQQQQQREQLQQREQQQQLQQQIMLRDFSQPPSNMPFDKCPIICSLFALLCCPITYCCSLPALLLSICSYTDYRVHDLARFRSKSDCARRLIITACIVGLLIVIGWSVLTFFYRMAILKYLRNLISKSQSYSRRGP